MTVEGTWFHCLRKL